MNIADEWADAPYPAPPDRLPPVPRRVAWNTKARWLRTGVVAALLFGPNVILVCGWQMGNDLRELEARGETVTGKVVDKTFYMARGGAVRKVDYSFEIRGHTYRDVAYVTPAEFTAFSKEGPFDVTYLRDHPETHCQGHPEPLLRHQNDAAVTYALIAAGVCAAALVWVEFRLRREYFLAREGEPAVGRITERGQTRSKNRIFYWVSHAFTAPDGQPLTSWHYVPSPLWERLRPSSRVTLLYDPARPRRHLPLYAFEYAYIVEGESPEVEGGETPEGIENTSFPEPPY